eukprot:1158682-Amphidinium_carterae.1
MFRKEKTLESVNVGILGNKGFQNNKKQSVFGCLFEWFLYNKEVRSLSTLYDLRNANMVVQSLLGKTPKED